MQAPRDSSLGVLLCVGRSWNGETLAPGAHLSTASRSPSPFQGRHRFPATYVVTVNANGSPERVELSGGQFDSVKSSLDSWARSALRGCPRRTQPPVRAIPLTSPFSYLFIKKGVFSLDCNALKCYDGTTEFERGKPPSPIS